MSAKDEKLSLNEFVRFADSVGYDIQDSHPVESLAFQTVASVKLNPHKEFSLNRNELTIFDTIIFTMFIVRMICITQIKYRAKAEEFSELYIKKVFEYFPESKRISEKYDSDFFAERVTYYDSLIAYDSLSFEDCTSKIVAGFEEIMKYDYAEQYVRFNQGTPLMILDFSENLKISADVKIFFRAMPDFFTSILPDVFKIYNKDDTDYITKCSRDSHEERRVFQRREIHEPEPISAEELEEKIDKIIEELPHYAVERFYMERNKKQAINELQKSTSPVYDITVREKLWELHEREMERQRMEQREHQENMSCLWNVLSPFIGIGIMWLIVGIFFVIFGQ